MVQGKEDYRLLKIYTNDVRKEEKLLHFSIKHNWEMYEYLILLTVLSEFIYSPLTIWKRS